MQLAHNDTYSDVRERHCNETDEGNCEDGVFLLVARYLDELAEVVSVLHAQVYRVHDRDDDVGEPAQRSDHPE